MLDHNMHYLKMLYFVSITSLLLTLPLLFFLDGAALLSYDYVSLSLPCATLSRVRHALPCLHINREFGTSQSILFGEWRVEVEHLFSLKLYHSHMQLPLQSAIGDPVTEIFPLVSGIALTNFTQNVAAFGFLSLVNPVRLEQIR